ncbi:glycosyltransferase [Erwinia aphidicola]|uniref:Glycosyltransferase n=1 Tax=Erwinia aphidicola TaxID=68334 RepID=A0ABU8DIB3_ERWAP
MNKKNVVVSAVNLNQGGTLTVAKELLSTLDDREDINVTALVHKIDIFPSYKNIKLIEFPSIKKSWLKRLYFEFYTSSLLSKALNADIWFCAHDITANVTAKKTYVYCHNPSPFYSQLSLSDLRNDYKFWLFVHLYRFLYRINIKKNTAVFVQQQWIAKSFKKFFNINNVIVARPEKDTADNDSDYIEFNSQRNNAVELDSSPVKLRVFYPSVPRVFKNFEVLLAAAALLEDTVYDITFVVTFDGQENSYSRSLFKKYQNLSNVEFTGYLTKLQMDDEYQRCDIVCFPSKLETWGLPITEAKMRDIPLVLADLEYAHETVGKYDNVCFFPPDDHFALFNIIVGLANKENILTSVDYTSSALNGWESLVDYILKD